MQSGRWYQTNAKPLKRARTHAKALCRLINTDTQNRLEFLDTLLPNVSDTSIGAAFYCDYGVNIHSEGIVKIGDNVVLLDAAPIHIGDNVVLGDHVTITTVNHHPDNDKRLEGWQQAKPITIGNDVIIEDDVVILPGAKVASGLIIPANSVVTPSKVVTL